MARLPLSHPLKKGRFHLAPRIAAVWMSADTADYYHGVRLDEATQDRRVPCLSTTNLELGLRAAWAINGSDFIAVDVSGTFQARPLPCGNIQHASRKGAMQPLDTWPYPSCVHHDAFCQGHK